MTRDRGGIVRPVAGIDHARVQRRRAARARRHAETRSSATGRGRDASARHNEFGHDHRARAARRGRAPTGRPRAHGHTSGGRAREGHHVVRPRSLREPGATRYASPRRQPEYSSFGDTSNNRFATGCQLAMARARASAIFSSGNDPPHERRRSDTNTPSPLQPTLYTSSDPRATFSPIDPAHLAPP